MFDSSVLDQEMQVLYGQHNHHHHHNQKNNSNGSNNNHNNGSSSGSSSRKRNTNNNGENSSADGVLSTRSVRPRHDNDDNDDNDVDGVDVDGVDVMIGRDGFVGVGEAGMEGDVSSGMEIVKDGNIDVVAVSETLDSTIGINNNKKNNIKGYQRQNEKDGETSIVNVRKKKNKSARYDEPIKTNKTLSN